MEAGIKAWKTPRDLEKSYLWGVKNKGWKGNRTVKESAEYQIKFSSSQACIIYCTICKLNESVTISETIKPINTSKSFKVHQTAVQN